MSELFEHPKHIGLWGPLEEGNRLIGKRSSVATGLSWTGQRAFYRELMERYPGVKVILTVRDPGTDPASWVHPAGLPASDEMRLPVERKMPGAWRAMNRLWSTRKAEKLAEEIMLSKLHGLKKDKGSSETKPSRP
jgi:hypothetical protein